MDTVCPCVDRESGWMVTNIHNSRGVTAEKVSKAMYATWDMFGVPSVGTTERSPLFKSAWWYSLCAAIGTYPHHSQAYHHQANGRAENAGQQLKRKLQKLLADPAIQGLSWVDLLPRALRSIHDAPGESGYSAYELVFGRHRPMAGLPHQPRRETEEANQFFA